MQVDFGLAGQDVQAAFAEVSGDSQSDQGALAVAVANPFAAGTIDVTVAKTIDSNLEFRGPPD